MVRAHSKKESSLSETIKPSRVEKTKVGIIDSHVDSVTSMSNFLEERGFDTIWAYKGKDAIAKFSKDDFDILVVSIKLDDMSGFLVAKEFPKVKVVFVTAYDGMEQEAKMFPNCIGVLKKPVDFEELEFVIRKAFG
jgi:DNA-binding response OmpR family regulator